MKTSLHICNDADDYRDVSIYINVNEETGEDYKFQVSLDKETGRVFDGDWEYSPDSCTIFDWAEDVPAQVRQAMLTRYHEAREAARTGELT